MLLRLYMKVSPLLAAFFLLTSVVFFVMCLWRGEIILGLQTEALKYKDQSINLVIEQHEGANKISHEFEIRQADREQEKVYVDREIEKIVYLPSYSNECFDAAGLQQINNRIKSLNGTGEPTSTVSKDTGAN